MKSIINKLALMGALLFAIGITACTELVENTPSLEAKMSFERMEANIKSLGIKVPENWEKMNIEEKMQFMQSQDKDNTMGKGLGNGGNTERMKTRFEQAGIEIPDNWIDLSREERQKFMTENGM